MENRSSGMGLMQDPRKTYVFTLYGSQECIRYEAQVRQAHRPELCRGRLTKQPELNWSKLGDIFLRFPRRVQMQGQSPEETGGPASGGIEDFRGAITQQVNPAIMNFSRFARVRQIRGSTDEATAAYTMTYVRIPEEGVRSRWRAIVSRYKPLILQIAF